MRTAFTSFTLKKLYSSVAYLSQTMKPTKLHELPTAQSLQLARKTLLAGEVIAIPTDTVYGLACDANNAQAIQKLYAIKGRDFKKPVAICVKNISAFRRYGKADHLSDELLQSLLPGPITIVIERTLQLNNAFLNPSTSRIGIRIPQCDFVRELCNVYEEQPLALTSANTSGHRSTLHVREFEHLWPQLGAVFDAGGIGLTEARGSASTVIDLADAGYYSILREGAACKSTLKILQNFGLKSCIYKKRKRK